MDKSSEDDELIKLLDVKDIEFIEASELLESFENDQNYQNAQIGDTNENRDSKSNGIIAACTERRSDEPTELSFEKGDPKQFFLTNSHALSFVINSNAFVYKYGLMSHRFQLFGQLSA